MVAGASDVTAVDGSPAPSGKFLAKSTDRGRQCGKPGWGARCVLPFWRSLGYAVVDEQETTGGQPCWVLPKRIGAPAGIRPGSLRPEWPVGTRPGV